jgi:regulator of protease activity HflC (stomatin/prohibitin superfamily)
VFRWPVHLRGTSTINTLTIAIAVVVVLLVLLVTAVKIIKQYEQGVLSD